MSTKSEVAQASLKVDRSQSGRTLCEQLDEIFSVSCFHICLRNVDPPHRWLLKRWRYWDELGKRMLRISRTEKMENISLFRRRQTTPIRIQYCLFLNTYLLWPHHESETHGIRKTWWKTQSWAITNPLLVKYHWETVLGKCWNHRENSEPRKTVEHG